MTVSVVSVGAVEVIEVLAGLVGRLDVAVLSGGEAAELTGLFARGERLCATAKAMTARRAGQAGQWAQAGHRDPEGWLAQVSGSSAGAARASLAVAEQMDAQPELARACQAGRLSPAQAGEIAAATAVDPGCAPGLIDTAGREGLARLRQSCRQVVMAGRCAADDAARRAALQQGRYLRTWTDRDGAGRVDAATRAGPSPAHPASGPGIHPPTPPHPDPSTTTASTSTPHHHTPSPNPTPTPTTNHPTPTPTPSDCSTPNPPTLRPAGDERVDLGPAP